MYTLILECWQFTKVWMVRCPGQTKLFFFKCSGFFNLPSTYLLSCLICLGYVKKVFDYDAMTIPKTVAVSFSTDRIVLTNIRLFIFKTSLCWQYFIEFIVLTVFYSQGLVIDPNFIYTYQAFKIRINFTLTFPSKICSLIAIFEQCEQIKSPCGGLYSFLIICPIYSRDFFRNS